MHILYAVYMYLIKPKITSCHTPVLAPDQCCMDRQSNTPPHFIAVVHFHPVNNKGLKKYFYRVEATSSYPSLLCHYHTTDIHM